MLMKLFLLTLLQDIIECMDAMFFFLTGTDEHGQKIANRAETEGVKPIEICDKYANGFMDLNKKLRISNDSYIRTTMPHHYKSAQTLWELCAKGKCRYLAARNQYYISI